jgi:flavin-dependent dehydrogenase
MVDDVLIEDGRAIGVTGHTSDGTFEERARIVIGADGRNSPVARAVGAGYVENSPALGGGYYSYWRGVECPGAELFLYDGQFTVAFPTHDGLTCVAMAVRPENFAEERKNADAHVAAMLDRLGPFGDRVRAGERAHDLISIGNLSNFLRQAWGPGWALVGDALYHKDPSPADGITDAFRGADFLADAVDDLLTGTATAEEAFGRYESETERYARPLLEKTITMSSFDIDSVSRATAFLEIAELHTAEADDVLGSKEPVPA